MSPTTDAIIQSVEEARKLNFQAVEHAGRIQDTLAKIRIWDTVGTAELDDESLIFARFLLRVHDIAYQLIVTHRFKSLVSTAPCGEDYTVERLIGKQILGNYVHYLASTMPAGSDMRILLLSVYDSCKFLDQIGTERYKLKKSGATREELKPLEDQHLQITANMVYQPGIPELYYFIRDSKYFNIKYVVMMIKNMMRELIANEVGILPEIHLGDALLSAELDRSLQGDGNTTTSNLSNEFNADLFWNPIAHNFLSPLMAGLPRDYEFTELDAFPEA